MTTGTDPSAPRRRRHAFASDLLVHIRARREAEEARTRHLLDLATSGVEPEPDDEDADDLKETA